MNKHVLIKEAECLLNELPEETSWDDLIYKIYARQKIEKGLSDCENNKVFTTENVREHFRNKLVV